MTTLDDVREKLREKLMEDHTSWTPQQFRAFLDEIMRDLLDVEVSAEDTPPQPGNPYYPQR